MRTQTPTVIGTAKPSVNPQPDHDRQTEVLLARSSTAASIAPQTANTNTTAEHGHVRPRGERRARAGQGVTDPRVTGDRDPGRPHAAFREAVHTDQRDAKFRRRAPRTPYWTSRDPVAPAIAPTTTDSRATQDSVAPPPLEPLPPESRCRWRPVPSPDRPRDRPPTAPQGGLGPKPGRITTYTSTSSGDNGDGGRLDVVTGLLESDNEKRPKKVDRQRQRQRRARRSPTSTSARTDPTPTARCDPCRKTKRQAPRPADTSGIRSVTLTKRNDEPNWLLGKASSRLSQNFSCETSGASGSAAEESPRRPVAKVASKLSSQILVLLRLLRQTYLMPATAARNHRRSTRIRPRQHRPPVPRPTARRPHRSGCRPEAGLQRQAVGNVYTRAAARSCRAAGLRPTR